MAIPPSPVKTPKDDSECQTTVLDTDLHADGAEVGRRQMKDVVHTEGCAKNKSIVNDHQANYRQQGGRPVLFVR
ncbi:MAG: hypothetical protein GY811_22975 [Myxococcales bacterium]|nr:hypothetical protein [Myxococcales bacterium]